MSYIYIYALCSHDCLTNEFNLIRAKAAPVTVSRTSIIKVKSCILNVNFCPLLYIYNLDCVSCNFYSCLWNPFCSLYTYSNPEFNPLQSAYPTSRCFGLVPSKDGVSYASPGSFPFLTIYSCTFASSCRIPLSVSCMSSLTFSFFFAAPLMAASAT